MDGPEANPQHAVYRALLMCPEAKPWVSAHCENLFNELHKLFRPRVHMGEGPRRRVRSARRGALERWSNLRANRSGPIGRIWRCYISHSHFGFSGLSRYPAVLYSTATVLYVYWVCSHDGFECKRIFDMKKRKYGDMSESRLTSPNQSRLQRDRMRLS